MLLKHRTVTTLLRAKPVKTGAAELRDYRGDLHRYVRRAASVFDEKIEDDGGPLSCPPCRCFPVPTGQTGRSRVVDDPWETSEL